MIECSLITYYIHALARLPVPPVFIYDIWCILIFYDHYHEQSISYKDHQIDSTIIYMHAG